MTIMSYNGINFGDVRSSRYTVENVYDDSGLDLLWQKITITVSAIMNLELCASNKTTVSDVSDPTSPDNAGIPGDRMPISLERLRHTLSQPMKRLLFRIGNDLVLDSPVPLPDGSVPLRDCDFGPKPDPVIDVTQIIGDVTALINFTVSTCVSDCNKYIVSNRWTMSHAIDQYGYMTRTTRGTAIVRSDLMSLIGDMNADSFRKEFFVPADTPLQRVHIDANLDEGGVRLTYTLTDVLTTYTITTEGVVKVEGEVTASTEGFTKSSFDAASGFARAAAAGGKTGGWQGAIAGGTLFGLETLVPRGHAYFTIRVFGRRNSPLRSLYNVALKIASDRFSGALTDDPKGRYPLADLHVTLPIGNMEEPWVQLRGQLWLQNITAGKMEGDIFAGRILEFSYDFGQGLGWSQTASPTPQIGTGNAAGFLAQVLSYMPIKIDPCELPTKPADIIGYFETASGPA